MKHFKSNKIYIWPALLLIVILSLIFVFRNDLNRLIFTHKNKQNIASYKECVDLGYQKEITSPKSCKADGETFFDAKELLPDTIIKYKLADDDGVDLRNERKSIKNSDCNIQVDYKSSGVNYAKNFTTKSKSSEEKLGLVFNSTTIQGYGVKIQTPEVGSFSIICLEDSNIIKDKIVKENLKQGGLDNLYFLNSELFKSLDTKSIYLDDRYNSGQINWYFKINDKAYFVSEWKNFAEKIDLKINYLAR